MDISPLRRVNQAIYLLTTGARESAFRNIKTIAECLADELINAAKGSSNRYCIALSSCTGKVTFPDVCSTEVPCYFVFCLATDSAPFPTAMPSRRRTRSSV